MCKLFLIILITLLIVGEITSVHLLHVLAVGGAWVLFAALILYCFSFAALLTRYGLAKVLSGVELSLFCVVCALMAVAGCALLVSCLIAAWLILFHLSTEKVDKVFKSHD